MVTPVTIADRRIGPGEPCFIIAEAGVNHNGDLELAKQLIDIAVEAKADAVKFQTFQAERLASAEAPKARYQLETTDAHESQVEMLRRLELSPEAHQRLAAYCRERDIVFLSTPFDEASADLLGDLGVAAFKISSGDLTNLPLLIHVAKKGQPIILSTGMSTLEEVHEAVQALRSAKVVALILLHCVSSYPADPSDINLRAIQTLAEAFDVPVGYSDHTIGLEVSFAAVALGARVIEKHVTLDRALSGPDHRMSLEPAELTALVRGIRNVESALGNGKKVPASSEFEVAAIARKSLVAARHIPLGSTLTEELIAIKRPGTGLSPAMLKSVVGRRVRQEVPAGTVLTRDMVG